MDWTKRVEKLHRLAHDYHDAMIATVEDYGGPELYVKSLAVFICKSEPITDANEQRVIQNELERIVGIS